MTPSLPKPIRNTSRSQSKGMEKKKAIKKLKELEEDISSLQSKIVTSRQEVLKREIKALKI